MKTLLNTSTKKIALELLQVHKEHETLTDSKNAILHHIFYNGTDSLKSTFSEDDILNFAYDTLELLESDSEAFVFVISLVE